MNSFQSLLNSYSQLRKRTYEFRTISEGGISANAAFRTQCPRHPEIVQAFGLAGGPGDKEAMLSAFKLRAPMAEGEESPDGPGTWVRVTADNNFNFRSSVTKQGVSAGSLPVSDLACIEMYLASVQLEDPDLAIEKGGDDEGNETDVYVDHEVAQNKTRLNVAYNKLFPHMPFPDFLDQWSTFAPMTIHPMGTPGHQMGQSFQELMNAMYGSGDFSPEELREATLELQRDTIELLEFFADDTTRAELDAALESGECVPPTSQMLRLRERFFITQFKGNNKRALSYGNLGGKSDSPSAMANLMGKLNENPSMQSNVDDNWRKRKDGTPHSGQDSAAQARSGGHFAATISANTEQDQAGEVAKGRKASTSGLYQMVDKYKDVKLCTAEGEEPKSLFEVTQHESATQLSNQIAEKSSVLVDVARRISMLPDKGPDGKPNPQKEKLKNDFDDGIQELATAAEKDCEQLKGLVRLSNQANKVNDGPLPGTPVSFKALSDMINETGTDNDICGMGGDFLETFKHMAHRELASPFHQSINKLDRDGELEGTVVVTDVHPDGRKVSQITGREEGRRKVADNLAVCSSRNDVLKLFADLGINPNSRAAQELLNNPYKKQIGRDEFGEPIFDEENPKYIIPLSDKFYREAGMTSQGNLEKGGAYRDEALVNNHVDTVYHGHPDIEQIRKDAHTERKAYLEAQEQAIAQLIDPKILDLPGGYDKDRANLADKVQGNTLDEFLEAELKYYANDPEKFARVQLMIDDIKKLREDHGKDPNSPSAAGLRNSLSHSLADMKRDAARRNMGTKERRRSEAASYDLNSMAGHGSQLAVLIPKSWDSMDTPLITEDDIRCLNRMKSDEIRSGKPKYSDRIGKSIKNRTRRNPNKSSGSVQVSITTSVNAREIAALVKETGCP